jgi:hypothetical protein
MTNKHNKKRNVGIVYEQLLRFISKQIIEDKQPMARKAIKIIENRFRKDKELYKEFRLVNALANSTVSGTHVAAGILLEAKQAARRIDTKKLMKEKSLLIKDINYELNESEFFHTKIDNYKVYATIQQMINEWKKNDTSNLSDQIKYEKLVAEHLISEKKDMELNNFDDRSDHLVFKVMSEKMNEKYSGTLTTEQKDIIRNYAIYSDDPTSLAVFLESVKKKSLKALKSLRESSDNKTLLSKINVVYENINNLRTDNIDDDHVKKYLTVSQLKKQIMESENER